MNNKIEISEHLLQFLQAWKDSVDKMNNEGRPDIPDLHMIGLCGPLWEWGYDRFGDLDAGRLSKELSSLFHHCNLHQSYPFGMWEYRGYELHRDENRLSWVNAALAGELEGWKLVKPLMTRQQYQNKVGSTY